MRRREPTQLDFDPPEEMLAGLNQSGTHENAMLLRSLTASSLLVPAPPVLSTGSQESKSSFINGSVFRSKIRDGLDMVVDGLPARL